MNYLKNLLVEAKVETLEVAGAGVEIGVQKTAEVKVRAKILLFLIKNFSASLFLPLGKKF